MLTVLFSQVKEYKKVSIMTPIFMILEVIFETLLPFLMASIIDDGVKKGDMNHIYIMGALMILLAFLSLYAGIMGGKCGAKASTGFAKNLRKAMYENIQTFSFSNIDKYSTPSLITRLTTDVTNLQNAYQMLLRMFTRAPATLIFAMFMAFTVNKKLASIYLVAVIFLAICLVILMSKATKYFNQVFKKYDDLNASVQENVSAIRVVKAYVKEDYEKGKFSKANYNVYKMFLKAEGILTLNGPLMMFTVNACIIFLSWFGARFIANGNINEGDLTCLITYCMNILMSLMMLSMVFVMVTMSYASARRVAEILTEKADITNPEDPIYDVKDGSIAFKNVSFSYKKGNGKEVLKNIDFNIKSGETIGIIGGTGSSKTSLVNLISRLYDVTEGELLVGGINVKKFDLETLRKNVAVVLQKNVLFSGSILDNLRWGDKNATEEECIRACKLACADEFIQKMPDKYNSHIEQGGVNVSGGQKQRLCIARALVAKPKILILDDSTSAVDTATDARIRKAFAEEIPDTTKIIIAQRISSVQNADRIIVMENGEVDGIGTHEELLENNKIYKVVFESQTGGNQDFDEVGGEA